MMKISLELVPNNKEKLFEDLKIAQDFAKIEAINIPDLLRFDIRSWEGCSYIKPYYDRSIPHIRAIDFDLDKPLPMADYLNEHHINEVLVLTGDLPQEMNRTIYHTTSIEMIRKFKEELPHIKVYAAIDPYRDSIKNEWIYTKKKIKAGADGFFTQPFFDLRLLEIYSDMLEDADVFYGVSPVVSDAAMNYWHAKNNVIFPRDFCAELYWNIEFAKRVLELCDRNDENVYLMPIKTNLSKYLEGVFGR